ncbi:MAG: extracellular solute-binding protein [Gammaproteobacteria bacterium]|nr:extracellular solute-binding protein [Gammaproteobacteria bacterium]NIR98422.1 extracellular solute-binding protein [Gammaproteobacteria bacterium]NIT64169.1 extracellular solute-binding protein [Gammaproteobacteria bacterium]NIV21109.1 extracellular solute-binding protein [Gammaproteobacteria bacterium]NIX10586.1 extracellular solute-binding protein [Gammaproteobacteria bacterium]
MTRILLVSLVCLGWFVGSPAAAAAEEVVVYSGRSDKFVRPVAEAFTRETGIAVVLHSAKSTELINRLRAEGDRTDADLYISNDAGNLQVGSDFGLFEPLPADIAGAVAPDYRAPDNSWVGLSARARVLVVNTRASDLGFVDSVLDLADPRLEGRIGITHSANGSFITGVTVYREMAGEPAVLEWLQGMRRNAQGRVYNKHSRIVRDVAAGKKDVGLVNHYYIYRHLDRRPDAPIRILIPDQGAGGMGVAWNVAGVALVKHSDNKAQAIRLVEFLVSRRGQKMFAEVNREYPTRPDVPAAAGVPPAGGFEVAEVPMHLLGSKRRETLDLIEQAGMP